MGLLVTLMEAGAAVTPRSMEVHLDPASREIRGELRLSAPTDGRFRLHPALSPSAENGTGETLALTRLAKGEWRLPETAGPVVLHWDGHLPARDNETGLSVSSAGSLLPPGSDWYPRFAALPPSPVTLAIRVPSGQRVVASGSHLDTRAMSGGVRARFRHPRTDRLALAAGPWQLREREAEGVTLRTLFPAQLDAAFADTYLDQAARHLARFRQRLGPYPFASFTMAASPTPVGFAFAGFTLLGETVIPLPFIPVTSLPHELMHGWWGVGIEADREHGNWSEALTTYLADHALAEARGEARATRQRWLTALSAIPPTAEMALVDFHGEQDPVSRLIGYQHGALFFHQLRRRLDDANFDDGLRRFAEEWMHRTAAWDDLQAAFEQTAGEPLGEFFAAWLTRPGRPTLAVSDVEIERRGEGYRIHATLAQQGDSRWPLTVPLVVETAEGEVHRTVSLTTDQAAVTVAASARPTALMVDPDFDVLRRLASPPMVWRHLRLDPETRVLALTPGALSAGRRLLGADAPLAGPGEPIAAPLLVVGSTEALRDWLDASDLSAPPRPMVDAGAARFWMLPERRIGLLSADTADGLNRLAGKMRHHGHRSFVVLDADGDTGEAGSWPQEETTLRVEFDP